jgi:hypothetical protein
VQQEPTQHQWEKRNVEPRKQFEAQNKKKIFKKARQEFLKPDIASTSTMQHNKEIPKYEMPPSLDHTKKPHPLGQASTIKSFLQSYFRLINDPSSVKVLQNMLERCSV